MNQYRLTLGLEKTFPQDLISSTLIDGDISVHHTADTRVLKGYLDDTTHQKQFLLEGAIEAYKKIKTIEKAYKTYIEEIQVIYRTQALLTALTGDYDYLIQTDSMRTRQELLGEHVGIITQIPKYILEIEKEEGPYQYTQDFEYLVQRINKVSKEYRRTHVLFERSDDDDDDSVSEPRTPTGRPLEELVI